MDYAFIATSVITALSPFVVKGLEKLTDKAVEEGFSERKAIWENVKGFFQADDLTLLNLLQDAESDVEKKGELKGELKVHLKSNPEVARDLEELLVRLKESTSASTITGEEITDSDMKNKIKRSAASQGTAEISHKKIERSRIESDIEIS